MMNREMQSIQTTSARRLAMLLRWGGSIEMLAFLAVAAPRDWLADIHEGLGMGTMPQEPVVHFLVRQVSLFYGLHGVLLWVLASNVVRFQPVIRFISYTFLLYGPTFFLIDWMSGIPLWWTISDPIVCTIFGFWLLQLNRGIVLEQTSA